MAGKFDVLFLCEDNGITILTHFYGIGVRMVGLSSIERGFFVQ